MAVTYISTADVDAQLTTPVRQALFTDDAAGSSYDSTEFDRLAQLASVLVKASAKNAGYSLASTTTDDSVVLATIGAFISMAFARKNETIPAAVLWLTNLPEALRSGDYPLTDTEPDPDHARGGNQFTESDPDVTGSRPSVYSDADTPLRDCY